MRGAPQIPSNSIHGGNGKRFTMEAKNLSKENLYVEKVELNEQPYDKKTITYKDTMNGSSLVFYMTDVVKK